MIVIDIVVYNNEGPLSVLEVILFCPLSNKGNAELLDEGDDLFVRGGFFAQGVRVVLVWGCEDFRHEDGDGFKGNLARSKNYCHKSC